MGYYVNPSAESFAAIARSKTGATTVYILVEQLYPVLLLETMHPTHQ